MCLSMVVNFQDGQSCGLSMATEISRATIVKGVPTKNIIPLALSIVTNLLQES